MLEMSSLWGASITDFSKMFDVNEPSVHPLLDIIEWDELICLVIVFLQSIPLLDTSSGTNFRYRAIVSSFSPSRFWIHRGTDFSFMFSNCYSFSPSRFWIHRVGFQSQIWLPVVISSVHPLLDNEGMNSITLDGCHS